MIWLLACAPALVPPQLVDDPDGDWDADGYTEREGDCDDADPLRSPGLVELCDGRDNDCDGVRDESDAQDAALWFIDEDRDGFGLAEQRSCEQPWRGVSVGGDCDDGDASVSPAAIEVCDGADQDCDGEVDEEAQDAAWWYADEDGDGAGDPEQGLAACEQPEGYVSDDQDCDDAEAQVAPGLDEVCGDGLDNDCSGLAAGPCWAADAELDAGLVRVEGEAGGDELGRALLASTGLLVVAATGSDRGGQGSGMVYVFEGVDEDPDAAVQVYGMGKNDNLGWALGSHGQRLLMSAPGAAVDEVDNSGVVYVLRRDELVGGAVESQAALLLLGEPSSRLGRSMSWLDAEGDGDLDVAVGAPFAEGDAQQSGAVWVFSARGSGERRPEDAVVGFVGEGSASWLGASSASGDLDGDGFDDLLLGAPGRRTTGSAYLLHGPVSGQPFEQAVEHEGATDGDFGQAVIACDLDGDGVDEALAAAPALGQLRELGSGQLVAEGDPGLGHALQVAGDLDGDGVEELLVGLGSPEQDLDGGVLVLWGGSTGVRLVEQDGSDLGAALAVGDLDADGHLDLVLGGPSYESDQRGQVVLLLGGLAP